MSLAIVRLALKEDIGSGDVTSRACVSASRRASGCFLARQELIVAGLEVLEEIYPEGLELRKRNGDRCADGEIIATVSGNAR